MAECAERGSGKPEILAPGFSDFEFHIVIKFYENSFKKSSLINSIIKNHQVPLQVP